MEEQKQLNILKKDQLAAPAASGVLMAGYLKDQKTITLRGIRMANLEERFICWCSCYNWKKWMGKQQIQLSEEEKQSFKNSIKAVQDLFIAKKKQTPLCNKSKYIY